MIQLRSIEATILEHLKQGKTVNEIGVLINKRCISHYMDCLMNAGAIERIGWGKYRIQVDEYEISDDKHKRSAEENEPIHIPTVSDDIKFYIKGHREKIGRTELARRLGINKTILLGILQQMA